jgi:hypothetical protein
MDRRSPKKTPAVKKAPTVKKVPQGPVVPAALFSEIFAEAKNCMGRNSKAVWGVFGVLFLNTILLYPSPDFAQHPLFLLLLFVYSVIAYLAGIFLYILAIEEGAPKEMVKSTKSLTFPLMGLYAWVFVRSFIWAPMLLGAFVLIPLILLAQRDHSLYATVFLVFIACVVFYIFMFINSMRYFLSSAIMIKDHTSIRESARRSRELSRGYLGKIIGNLLLLGLAAGALYMAFALVLPFERLALATQQIVTVFTTIFTAKLSLAVLEKARARA